MELKERFNKKISLTILQRQCIITVSILSTLFLINIWTRFRNDVLSFPLYAYIILIIIFLIPLFKKKR